RCRELEDVLNDNATVSRGLVPPRALCGQPLARQLRGRSRSLRPEHRKPLPCQVPQIGTRSAAHLQESRGASIRYPIVVARRGRGSSRTPMAGGARKRDRPPPGILPPGLTGNPPPPHPTPTHFTRLDRKARDSSRAPPRENAAATPRIRRDPARASQNGTSAP